jgi:hypothetical protein
MIQIVRDGVVPKSFEKVGRTTLAILASRTDIIRVIEIARTAHILRGIGRPSAFFSHVITSTVICIFYGTKVLNLIKP